MDGRTLSRTAIPQGGTILKNERGQRHNYVEDKVTVGFLTDPTLCIGCKACEVACKEWNDVPQDTERTKIGSRSYDHSGDLGASTWRHVKFVETETAEGLPRWLFLSDVCKHCDQAGCLDACPTGAIWRTEVGSVLVDDDRCNGCGYCVVSCPFGVIDRRGRPSPDVLAADAAPDSSGAGGAFKCTFCYDRQVAGKIPACANACPTDSILFGPLTDLESYASERIDRLRERGVVDVSLYGSRSDGLAAADGVAMKACEAGGVGGTHALSILVGGDGDQNPELWGQPSDPVAPRAYLASAWTSAFLGAIATAALCWITF